MSQKYTNRTSSEPYLTVIIKSPVIQIVFILFLIFCNFGWLSFLLPYAFNLNQENNFVFTLISSIFCVLIPVIIVGLGVFVAPKIKYYKRQRKINNKIRIFGYICFAISLLGLFAAIGYAIWLGNGLSSYSTT